VVVLDSSALLDYLLRREPEVGWVRERLHDAEWNLRAPHLLDVEVVAVIRAFVLKGEISDRLGGEVVQTLQRFRVRRYRHTRLLDRIWELRHNVTVRDGVYVALAEALDCPLVTTDLRLARAPGLRIEVLAP
jgi:predicted nucleic acid-binding protein